MTPTMKPLASIDIQPGHHLIEWHLGPVSLHGDTIISTLIAGGILLLLGFLMRRQLSVRRPTGVQLFFETVKGQVEREVEAALGIRTAPWVVPLAMALFLFLLFANWLALIPTKEYVPPPAADPNTTYALAILVIVTMHVVGVRRQGLGYYKHIFEKPRVLAPLRIIQELIKPFTLSLRLFGNIFAGVVMLQIFTLLPTYLVWMPTTVWKLFDLFIGLIQAFIFALLTILYFSMAIGPRRGTREPRSLNATNDRRHPSKTGVRSHPDPGIMPSTLDSPGTTRLDPKGRHGCNEKLDPRSRPRAGWSPADWRSGVARSALQSVTASPVAR